MTFHKTTPDSYGRLPGTLRSQVIIRDYGYDVTAFNNAHNWAFNCQLGRTVGSDTTECSSHHAYVSHGVHPLLRTSS